MRALIKILAVLVGLLLLALVGAYWYLSTLDISEYREEIAAKVQEVTGRELRLAGEMSLDVFPSPSLVITEAALANAEWASTPDFVKIKRVEAEVSLAELFAGKVTVSRIAVIDPVIALETDAKGRNNWTFGSTSAKSESRDGSAGLRVDVSNVEVRGGKLSYFDGATKRRATVGIDELLITPSGWFEPLVIALKGNVAISNAAWGSKPEFVSSGQIEASVSMSDWSGSDLVVERLALERPTVFLETDASGQNNWTLVSAPRKAEPESGTDKKLPFDLRELEIHQGTFSYRDGVAKTTREVVVDALEVKAQSDGNLDLNLKAKIDQRAVTIKGKVGSLAALFNNEPYAFDLNVGAGGAEVTADGSVQKPMDARGVKAAVMVKASNLSDLTALFGTASELSLPLEASAAVKDIDNGYEVENLKVSIGKSDLSGDLRYTTSKGRPRIESALVSGLLDLDEFSSGKAKQKSDKVIPGDPLPVDSLRSVDADVSYKANQVRSAGLEINALTLDLKLRNGRLSLTPRGGLYGGEFNGQMGLDAAADRPRFETDLKAKQVNLGALVNALQKSDVLSDGPTDLSLKLTGTGKSPREIASSANGLLVTTIGPGKIHTSVVEKVGADAIMQAVRAASGEGQSDYTSFQCGVARFDIKKGEAVTKKGIAVQNPRMNVIGSGTVDLGTEDIDLAIKTEPREGAGLSVSSVGLAIRVGGTLANPTTSVDPLGAAKAGASAAAAVATGGLSLLGQALFSRATADDAPCDTAMGIKSAKTTSSGSGSTATSTETRESGGSTSGGGSSATEAVTDTLKGVGDKLKGLFGN